MYKAATSRLPAAALFNNHNQVILKSCSLFLIVLYFTAIYPRFPAVIGTHLTIVGLCNLIGIPPSRGSLVTAPIAWVCGWTEVSLSPLPVIAVFAVPCKVQVLKADAFACVARPSRAAEGKYLMCCIFGCQRATENLNLALWQPKEKFIILIPLRSQIIFKFTKIQYYKQKQIESFI